VEVGATIGWKQKVIRGSFKSWECSVKTLLAWATNHYAKEGMQPQRGMGSSRASVMLSSAAVAVG